MAKQSQKSKDNNTILHAINKYTQILRSRRKEVKILLKGIVLRLLLKLPVTTKVQTKNIS